MRLLVTGSTGFLGGAFGRIAARNGYEVIGVGRSAEAGDDWPGAYLRVDDQIESISATIAATSPEVVFHGAGTASVGASFSDPYGDFQGSVVTCMNLLEAVRRSTCRPLVFIPSSAAVYGNADSLPINESAPITPISPYGLHKSMCEMLARGWASAFGLRVVIGRLFSVFGPTQRRLLIWELFHHLTGELADVTIEGTGSESRDFLYVDDAASAFLQLAEVLREGTAGYFEIVNVASGEETTVARLANNLRDMVAPQKQIRYRGLVRPGDPSHWRADISKLTSMLPDWRAQPLPEGLATCIKSWREPTALQHGA